MWVVSSRWPVASPDSSCFPTHRPTSGHVNAIFTALPVLHPVGEAWSLGQTGLSDDIIPGQQPSLRLRPTPTSLVHEGLGPVASSRLSDFPRASMSLTRSTRTPPSRATRPWPLRSRSTTITFSARALPETGNLCRSWQSSYSQQPRGDGALQRSGPRWSGRPCGRTLRMGTPEDGAPTASLEANAERPRRPRTPPASGPSAPRPRPDRSPVDIRRAVERPRCRSDQPAGAKPTVAAVVEPGGDPAVGRRPGPRGRPLTLRGRY